LYVDLFALKDKASEEPINCVGFFHATSHLYTSVALQSTKVFWRKAASQQLYSIAATKSADCFTPYSKAERLDADESRTQKAHSVAVQPRVQIAAISGATIFSIASRIAARVRDASWE